MYYLFTMQGFFSRLIKASELSVRTDFKFRRTKLAESEANADGIKINSIGRKKWIYFSYVEEISSATIQPRRVFKVECEECHYFSLHLDETTKIVEILSSRPAGNNSVLSQTLMGRFFSDHRNLGSRDGKHITRYYYSYLFSIFLLPWVGSSFFIDTILSFLFFLFLSPLFSLSRSSLSPTKQTFWAWRERIKGRNS